jgi:hypothetical protein
MRPPRPPLPTTTFEVRALNMWTGEHERKGATDISCDFGKLLFFPYYVFFTDIQLCLQTDMMNDENDDKEK